MNKQSVIRVPILPMGLVNAHLIVGDTGAILVDAGLPGTERHLEKVLHQHGLRFNDIKLIVITHAHVDHAGNAARIRNLSGALIAAHAGDLPFYLRERPMTFCSTGWFGRAFLKTGLMYEPYEAFMPDILLQADQELGLEPFGGRGRLVPTPGHTSGSLSVVLDDDQRLVGDLLASGILLGGLVRNGHPKQPPFEDDHDLVAEQLAMLIDTGGQRFYIGHGGPLTKDQVARHVRYLRRINAGLGASGSSSASDHKMRQGATDAASSSA